MNNFCIIFFGLIFFAITCDVLASPMFTIHWRAVYIGVLALNVAVGSWAFEEDNR